MTFTAWCPQCESFQRQLTPKAAVVWLVRHTRARLIHDATYDRLLAGIVAEAETAVTTKGETQ
jgi:hypothetical protein